MNNIIWFRNDLRIEDNISLVHAMKGKKVIAYYCFESLFFKEDIYGFKRTEKFRAKFLIETLKNLKEQLKQLHIPLFVYQGESATHLTQLINLHQIDNVYLQKEWTRDEQDIVNMVKNKARSTTFIETFDQFLFHPEDIPYSSYDSIPEIFTSFRKKCELSVKVRPIAKITHTLPLDNLIETHTHIPTITELGFNEFTVDKRTAFPFKGGTSEAKERIDHYFWKTRKLAYYKKTRNGLVGTDYSSKLSPWLANGSISPRMIFWEVKHFEKEITKNQDTYWLIFELIWRDYFKYISLKHQNTIFLQQGILQKKYDWKNTKGMKTDWINGMTNEPFVNANMKELAMTGWLSNRGRQNVASFWSKEKEQDWRIGAAYFESMLIDYDVHSNYGNWMYASGVGNDPRDRKFNIKIQAERYDGNGKYQRLWLQDTLF
ncbi:DASH family cryptochrome [Maribacter confluentis]|uniref:Cryptochrome DASH n=1 Tax=Maribacter confluentis TaxID=1656093 RepID=A0ABT8RM17_9FLAO|nr:DASH family cryptochrome [Maribacter confluentis]MDO1511928.1 DASH family cryptochrome [Maribacter confluentis]